MPVDVPTEIRAYLDLATATGDRTLEEAGFQIRCAPGVMPPNNRVTRCFGRFIATCTAHRALDLGCGTGILALIAARRCERVIGIDLDPRAVACAQDNAARNAADNVTFLVGDAFEPVASRRFDLVFSNPPFYPVPGADSEPPGQVCVTAHSDLLYSLIAGACAHLAPGGRALFVTSSLSDNESVTSMLRAQTLLYTRRVLHDGRGRSQDIFLWEFRAPG